MIVAAVVIGILVLLVLLVPFFLGPGGALAPAATETSPERLRTLQTSILQRYLSDEKAFQRKDISRRAWQRRREFLLHRYIDASRRLDFLQHAEDSKGGRK